MLSNNKIKFFNSLKQKKYRDEHQLFIAEGEKICLECIDSGLHINTLICTQSWFNKFSDKFKNGKFEIIITEIDKIKKVSSLKSTPEVFCIIHKNECKNKDTANDGLILVYESLQDPGNLGTIIRTADWFGIKHIICSEDSVDVYNAKVIQASMGSFIRVNVSYKDLEELIKKTELPVYGTFMEGASIYKKDFKNNCLVLFGNEGKGISESLEQIINTKITIPSFDERSAESLNVSTATAIICSEFKRRSI